MSKPSADQLEKIRRAWMLWRLLPEPDPTGTQVHRKMLTRDVYRRVFEKPIPTDYVDDVGDILLDWAQDYVTFLKTQRKDQDHM